MLCRYGAGACLGAAVVLSASVAAEGAVLDWKAWADANAMWNVAMAESETTPTVEFSIPNVDGTGVDVSVMAVLHEGSKWAANPLTPKVFDNQFASGGFQVHP